MDPSLMVIGLNYRTAPVAVRERYWISESRRGGALAGLVRSEGIEEVVVLPTCDRTEFYLWANDPSLAANSVVRFLSSEYGLKLCEWKHFYRLLDDQALLHIFRVATSLDSMVPGEPQITAQLKTAWQLSQNSGASSRFLDCMIQKALTVSKRVGNETPIGNSALSVPYAAVELARQTLGTLADKRVLLMGAGKMSELSARYLVNQGAGPVCVISRTLEHAQDLAASVGGTAATFEGRRHPMVNADIVISSTTCPHIILNREDAESVVHERGGRPLILVDIAMPRDIAPDVREVKGVFLYDLDDLEKVVVHNTVEREAAARNAQKMVAEEAQGFCRKLLSERVVPTIVALRNRLNEICRQERDSFKQERGPFSKEQDGLFDELTNRVTRKIAGALARELREHPEKAEQDQLSSAVERLFHLEKPEKAPAGATH